MRDITRVPGEITCWAIRLYFASYAERKWWQAKYIDQFNVRKLKLENIWVLVESQNMFVLRLNSSQPWWLDEKEEVGILLPDNEGNLQFERFEGTSVWVSPITDYFLCSMIIVLLKKMTLSFQSKLGGNLRTQFNLLNVVEFCNWT